MSACRTGLSFARWALQTVGQGSALPQWHEVAPSGSSAEAPESACKANAGATARQECVLSACSIGPGCAGEALHTVSGVNSKVLMRVGGEKGWCQQKARSMSMGSLCALHNKHYDGHVPA